MISWYKNFRYKHHLISWYKKFRKCNYNEEDIPLEQLFCKIQPKYSYTEEDIDNGVSGTWIENSDHVMILNDAILNNGVLNNIVNVINGFIVAISWVEELLITKASWELEKALIEKFNLI